MGVASYRDVLRVVVVDDHDLVRRGMISLLSEIPGVEMLAEAASGEEAVRLARELKPDVVLMDLRMPGMGGLEAARRIRIWAPEVRVIAVTAWTEEPMQRLHRNGIAACVGKNVGRDQLEATLRRVTGRAADTIAEPAPGTAADSANPFDNLTGREMQVCSMILSGQRAPDIARRLFITAKTVHTFRYRIYEKLGVSGDVELARLAASHGLIGANP
jgi:DNA-binding NarL/FixJ family response regulator